MELCDMFFLKIQRQKSSLSHVIGRLGRTHAILNSKNVFQWIVYSVCHSLHILPFTTFVMWSKKLFPAGPIILNNGLFYISRLLNQQHS